MIELTSSNLPPLRMPWKNCIAVGRAYELLRQDLLEHLAKVQREISFRYCRFHGIFHDDMEVVVRRPDGTLAFQWHQVDKIYDALLALGLRPFVEFGAMPRALASGEQTIFHWKMNVTPPKSYAEWGQLVGAMVAHLVDRYGLEEVRQWYFEVWNEPNLSGFWSGTQEEYWKLYDAAAEAVKSVDRQLRIGGPASSKASWIEDMIGHCHQDRTPLDFVSTHLYPQDEYVDYPGGPSGCDVGVSPACGEGVSPASSPFPAVPSSGNEKQQQNAGKMPATHADKMSASHAGKMPATHAGGTPASQEASPHFSPYAPGQYFIQRIREARQRIDRSPMPHLPIHWTEFNSISCRSSKEISWVDNPCVDQIFAASFAARVCAELDGDCDTLCWWTASDIFEESGMPHSPFSSTYGLLTIHGLAKASFNAFAMLAKMRGGRLGVKASSAAPEGCGLVATGEHTCRRVLLWNHEFPERAANVRWKDTLRLAAPSQGDQSVVTSRIAVGAGSAYETWCAMGRPHNLSTTELELLDSHSRPRMEAQRLTPADGQVERAFDLAPNEVLYIEIRPCSPAAVPKGPDAKDVARWDLAMGERSR
jgi:beta-xylosidase